MPLSSRATWKSRSGPGRVPVEIAGLLHRLLRSGLWLLRGAKTVPLSRRIRPWTRMGISTEEPSAEPMDPESSSRSRPGVRPRPSIFRERSGLRPSSAQFGPQQKLCTLRHLTQSRDFAFRLGEMSATLSKTLRDAPHCCAGLLWRGPLRGSLSVMAT